MTYAEREAIFSKEYISTASTFLQTIKRRVGDRLGIRGKIHIQDYLDFFNLDGSSQRYSKLIEE